MRIFFQQIQVCILVLVFVLTGSWSSAAQDGKDGPGGNPKAVSFKEKKATLNFEDELVEGTTQKPDLFYLFQRKNFNYNKLIKLRENFLPEMRKTTEDIQRVRGAH